MLCPDGAIYGLLSRGFWVRVPGGSLFCSCKETVSQPGEAVVFYPAGACRDLDVPRQSIVLDSAVDCEHNADGLSVYGCPANGKHNACAGCNGNTANDSHPIDQQPGNGASDEYSIDPRRRTG